MICSANYFGFDDVSTIDGERTSDRICAIPFGEMGDMTSFEFASRQRQFKAVIDSNLRPTELVIGEIGDYILTEDFLEKRNEFAEWLLDTCGGTLKLRTLVTNYASFLSVLWKLHSTFENIWTEMVNITNHFFLCLRCTFSNCQGVWFGIVLYFASFVALY